MAYSKVGPFTDNSAAPPINAAFLNGVENTLVSTTALAESAAPMVERVTEVAASGTAVTLADPSVASMQRITLTANCTITLPAPQQGKSILVNVVQDATGGRTVTWAVSGTTTLKWGDQGAPVLSTGAAKQDLISFVCVKNAWFGVSAGMGF
jgi:hypothetical protein